MSEGKKVAVITGASQGIGAGLVDAYLERNYRVVGTSRTIEPAVTADFVAIAGDIGDPSTGPRVIAEALGRFGRLDTLVNNAGIFMAVPFAEYTPEQYSRLLETNLNGFFYTTQAAIAAMETRGGGHVVNVTTTLVDHPIAGVPSVLTSLTKGGLAAATRSLAIEYATRGIRVNAVSPGIIRTPMHAKETHDFLASLHPMRRLGDIADIVDAVLYLESAHFVTGEILHVDGGQVAGH